ncbi:hypothetical protein F183_A01190 [Bryobacterales bacterium F-183]|nr:hypothetical protein F183_A01190 [Bryobacterales bacterium F-183]
MKALLPFTFLGLASVFGLAAAESHTVTIYQATQINGKTFKPGDVKLELNDNGQVTLKQGKNMTELKAKVEEGSEKFLRTTVGIDGESKSIKEIRLGGTTKTLWFRTSDSATPAN